jgi:hypothetical protein
VDQTEYGSQRQKVFQKWNRHNAQLIQAIEIYSLENKFNDHVCCMNLEYFPDAIDHKIKIVKVEVFPIVSTKF